jgi:DNA modification methylase
MPDTATESEFSTLISGELPYTWKTAGRGWGHSLHKLSQYIGAYPPSLAHYFITQLSDEGQVVLDPFSGGGTTALEAILLGRKAIASDAFFYAYILSHAKARPMPLDRFRIYLKAKIEESQQIVPDREELENRDLLASYSPSTLIQILRLRELLRDDESEEAIFTKGLICGVLHGPSAMFLSLPQKDTVSSTPRYVERYSAEHNLHAPDRDVYECALNKAQRCLKSLPTDKGDIHLSDSRNLGFVDSESVDLIVTSPPYLAVLDYTWNNWLRVWWLGRDRAEERANLVLTRVEAKYRPFMRDTLAEMYRVLRPDSAAVIVVGDVKMGQKAKAEILNSALLIAEEARHVGFGVDALINDVYDLHNRSMLVFNSLKWSYEADEHETKSSVLIDRCLVLSKGKVNWRNRPIFWENGQLELGL